VRCRSGLNTVFLAANYCVMYPLLRHVRLRALCIILVGGPQTCRQTANDMELVHWPLMGGLLHLV